MNKALKNVSTLASLAAVVAGFALSPVTVLADAGGAHYDPGNIIVDNFNNLYYRPDSRAYWYVENRGVVNGVEINTRETVCQFQSCVKHMRTEEDGNFVRLQIFPHNFGGYFTLANLSEREDGLGGENNDPGPWTPTVGHPVVIESTFRFSPNMGRNGDGGATGSAGLFMWNNPYSPSIYSQGPNQDAIGWVWQPSASAIPGFWGTVAQQSFPLALVPARNQDISKWNDYKIVWSVDENGAQTATFYVNGELVGTSPTPSYSHMSLEMWVDNQVFTFGGIHLDNVLQGNYMDFSSIKVSQK